jgi:phenylalanyl-tRNA synthetase alpha chain
MSSGAEALHPIERALLKALSGEAAVSVEDLSRDTGLEIDQVRRGVEWLRFKKLVSVNETSSVTASLTQSGLKSATSGLPERRLVEAIRNGMTTVGEVTASGRLQKDEANAAIAAAKRNGWIQFGQAGKILVLNSDESAEERLLKKLQAGDLEPSSLSAEEKAAYELLAKRPDYVQEKELRNVQVSLTEIGRSTRLTTDAEGHVRKLSPELITSGKWKTATLASLDVEASAPAVFAGRRHPLVDIIEEIKEIFVGLGFEEIDGPMVQSGFWNFDALYIPQDHPAREMQDTFYVKGHSLEITASNEQQARVAAVHKKGWGSQWNVGEAKRAVLRTHTTPVTLRRLASAKVQSGRFFSIGRVFRNEKPSYKHLVEFHQVEGVATARGLTLRDLMGLQKEFYARMGIKKIKFWPTFFPYTEPSLQSMVYNDKLQKWVELFGMGIFRPEVTNQLGIRNPVLAWGGGIERIAMLRYGLDDVRELFSSKLSWLRSVPKCQL